MHTQAYIGYRQLLEMLSAMHILIFPKVFDIVYF